MMKRRGELLPSSPTAPITLPHVFVTARNKQTKNKSRRKRTGSMLADNRVTIQPELSRPCLLSVCALVRMRDNVCDCVSVRDGFCVSDARDREEDNERVRGRVCVCERERVGAF